MRVLWLGRIIPRKRLDLFLDGAAIAIEQGVNLHLTIVGQIGFVAGYERLIDVWPHKDRLTWIKGIQRADIPQLMQTCDVLVQPSEEENFGSSVAEAQACGMPVIVGRSNGNGDYLCERDIHLADFRPTALAEALSRLASRKLASGWGDASESRVFAERCFNVSTVAEDVIAIIKSVHLSPQFRTETQAATVRNASVLGSKMKSSTQAFGKFSGNGEKQ